MSVTVCFPVADWALKMRQPEKENHSMQLVKRIPIHVSQIHLKYLLSGSSLQEIVSIREKCPVFYIEIM